MAGALDDVLARRLATQRLTGRALERPADVVRELVCVQAQDAPLSRYSIALRTSGGDASVRAAIDAGEIVRTHILRPTWHYVASEDLRWVLELTSAKVESGLAGRHRQLGLDASLIGRGMALLDERLRGRRFATRRDLGPWLAERGPFARDHELFGQRVGHLLMISELRGLICSGPLIDGQHSYALLDEVVAPARPVEREDALRELVLRFVASHGPVAIKDLVRWARLTQAEIKRALETLDDRVDALEVGVDALWFAPETTREPDRPRRAFLLSLFDEAYLSYRIAGFPRPADHPAAGGTERFAEAGGGPVICDLRDVGSWKRKARGGTLDIELTLAGSLDAGQRAEVEEAAYRLADVTGAVAHISFGTG